MAVDLSFHGKNLVLPEGLSTINEHQLSCVVFSFGSSFSTILRSAILSLSDA